MNSKRKERQQSIVEMLRDGRSVQEIAHHFNLSRQMISLDIRASGLYLAYVDSFGRIVAPLVKAQKQSDP